MIGSKKTLFILSLIWLVSISAASMAKERRRQRFECSEKVHEAIDAYNRGRYNKVKSILEEAKKHCGGHSSMDTVLYYLGKAHLATERPVEAKLEFEVLIQDFPNSPFYIESYFRLGYSSYIESPSYEKDQAKTKEAIRELSEFVDMFSQSPFADSAVIYRDKCIEKLAKKEFMNARFYERLEYFESAIVYYKVLIDEYPQSQYVPESKLSLAQNLLKMSRPGEATTLVDELLSSEEIRSDIRLRAQQLRKQVDQSLNNNKKSKTEIDGDSL